MFDTRCVPLLVLMGATFAACQGRVGQQPAVPSAFFIPEGARTLQHRERGAVQEVSYEVDAAYPASPFLCELTEPFSASLRILASSVSSTIRGNDPLRNGDGHPPHVYPADRHAGPDQSAPGGVARCA
jgi:hypothetical protein